MTMTTKHTPGPWTHFRAKGRIHIVEPSIRNKYQRHVVAVVHGATDANAALIASAPDLLAALHHALAALDDAKKLHPNWIYADAQNAARSAIAKAEGRTP